mmetsp:Transcript_95953/g.150097  ORF Transcript_95953/g.150097 Transcript_95953/m.150097 type:complete len:482 (-) Transcript_95953:35-1480(-)
MIRGAIPKEVAKSHAGSITSEQCDTKDHKCGLSAERSHDRHRFRELDSLRGLCTCIVILGHMWFAFGIRVPIPHLIDYSSLSVRTFFALSGHLVAYQYLRDGSIESLFSAIFRRVPRLFLPLVFANLFYWMLSTFGVNASESTWRKMIPNSTFCEGCIPSDLSIVIHSSIRVLWSFGRDHFVWLWTVSQEIYGSIIVFMLAPAFRWIVDSELWGLEKNICIGPLVMPRRLHRCILAYVAFFLLCTVLHAVSAAVLTSSIAAPQLQEIISIAHTFYLFTAGLAVAHISIVFGEAEQSIYCGSVPMKNLKKSLLWIPISFVVVGATSPWTNFYAEQVWYWKTGSWLNSWEYLCTLGAITLLAGVASIPQDVCTAMSKFSHVGKISYSLYLLHMSVVYAIGMPLYVWIHPSIDSAALIFAIVVVLTAGPMLIFAHLFWCYVEDPLGVRLPVYLFNALWRHSGSMTSLSSKAFHLLTTQVKLLCE